MTEIDERIVAMQFDNKNFEKHAKETIKTLEKLRENLDMDEAVDSLNDLTKVSKDLNLDKAAESAEKLHRAFTGVQKIASKTFSVATFPISKLGRALGGLASDVKKWFGIDLARTLEQSATKAVKALTVEPVSAGWNEYEMKMDSVKTILAGTKKEFASLSDEEHLGKVKSVLEDLNHYADETIYSFKDMTSNIGKFTNAGVKLDVAAKSMMGISNLAAQAGQGAQQASMAMYNFSQAMGLGYVELRDWRSIENANMATLEFKESLIEVGLAMGTLKKDSRGVVKTAVNGEKQVEVTSEKLRDTLNKKWLTSDVLSKALEIYSGELSREEIKRLGNFTDEQIDHFMELGAEAKKSATEVRTFTKMFDALKEAAQSGWAMSFEYIIGDINEATKLWSSINERISGWLNASAENRNKILQEWRGQKTDETGRVWNVSDHDGRQDLIDSLNSVLSIMENIGGAISKVSEDVFGKLDGQKLAEFTQNIADKLNAVNEWLGDIGDNTSRISKISRALKIVLAPLKAFVRVSKDIGNAIINFVLPFVDPVLDFFANLGDLVLNLVDGKISLGKFFEGIAKSAKAGWSQIKNVLFGNAGFNFDTKKALRDGPIVKFFEGIGQTVTTWVGKLKDGTAFAELGAWLTEKWNFIKDLILGPLVKDETTGKMVHSGPVGQLFDSISETINTEIEKFKNNPIVRGITDTLSGIFAPIKEFFVGKDFFYENGVKDHELGGFEIIINAVKSALGLDGGENDLTVTFATWSGSITEAWGSVTAWFTQANTDVTKFIEDIAAWTGWDKISEFFNGVWTVISGWFVHVFSRGTWDDIVGWYEEVNAKVTEFIRKVETWPAWNKIGNFFGGIWTTVSGWFSTTFSRGTWDEIIAWYEEVNTKVREIIDKVEAWPEWVKIGNFFGGIWTTISGWFSTVFSRGTWDSIVAWYDEVNTKVREFIDKVEAWPAWENVGNFFSSVWTSVSGWFSTTFSRGTWDDIVAWYEEINTKVTEFIRKVEAWPAWNKIGNFFGGIWTTVSGWFSTTFSYGTWNEIIEWYNGIDTSAREFIGKVQSWPAWENIGNFFGGIWTTVSGWFTNTFNRGMWDSIVGWYEEVNTKVREFIDKVEAWPAWENIGNFFSGIWTSVSGWWTNTFNKETWNEIKGWFDSAWATISNFLSGDSSKEDPEKESAFGNFVKNVWGEIVRIANEFGDTPIIQKIGTFLGDLWQVVSDFVTKQDPITGETPFGHMVTSIYNDINSFVNDAAKMATLDSLVEKLNGLWSSVSNILFPKKNENSISEKASGAKASDVGISGFAEVAQSLTAEWDANKGSIEEISSSVSSTLESATGTFNSATSFLDTLKQLIDDIKKKVEELNIGDNFSKTLTDISEGLSSFAGKLPDISTEGIGATVIEFFSGLSTSLGGLVDTITQKVSDWTGLDSVTDLINSLTGFVGDIGKNLEEFKAEAKQAWENSALKRIIDFVVGLFSAVGDLAIAFMQSAAEFLSLGIAPALAATAIATVATVIHDIHGFLKEGRKILKITKKNAILEQIPTGLLMIAGALYLITEALGKLGHMTQEEWDRGIERIALLGFILTLLFAAFKFLSNVFENNKSIEEQITAKMTAREKILSNLGSKLITFAAAFFIIKDALPALISSLNGVNVNPGTLLAAITGVVLLIGGISALIPTMAALGATIKVSWKEALIGIAGSLAAVGLVLEGISLLGLLAKEQNWVENFQTLGAVFGALVGGFAGQKDISYMTQILSGAGELADEAGNVNTSGLSAIGEIADMLSTIQSKLPKENTIFEKWFGGGTMSFENFAKVLPDLADGLRGYAWKLGDAKDIDYDAADKASSSLMKIANAIHYLNGIESNRIQYNAEKVFEFLNVLTGNKEFEKDFKGFSELTNIVNSGIESASEGIDAHWITDAIANGIRRDRDTINKAVQEVINSANMGVTIDNTNDGSASQTESRINQLASLFIGDTSVQTPDMGINLDGLLGGIVSGLDFGKYSSEIETSMDGLVSQMTGSLNGFNFDTGEYNLDSFSSMFLEDAMPDDEDIEASAKDMVRKIADSVKNGYSDMRYSGARLDQGLARGITDWSGVPINAMRNLCQRIINAAESEFDVGSPSRVFEQIGMFNMMGLQNGTDYYGDYAVNSVADIGLNYVAAMNEALRPLSQIITEDFDVNPVIRPVLNLEDIRSGTAVIGGLFGNRYSLGMSVPSMMQNSRVPEIRVNSQNNTAQAIASVNERLDQLNQSITNMQIVLDTGVLVGSTVSAYDRALGARASRARRG